MCFLIGPNSPEDVDVDGLAQERTRAFDLLDALTRSGSLPIEHAALHVVCKHAQMWGYMYEL